MTSFAELHDLTGQVAVVTGGSRGIGLAVAGVLAQAAAYMAGHDGGSITNIGTSGSLVAGAASSFTTGAIIRVDGGVTRKV